MKAPAREAGHFRPGRGRSAVRGTTTATDLPPGLAAVLNLQRAAENAAVVRLLQRASALTPTTVSDDPADSVGPVDFGSIVEDYPIVPAEENDLDREVEHSADFAPTGLLVQHRDTGRRLLTKEGLRGYLSTLAHGPLSPFEEQLIAGWGSDPMDKLIPLIRIGEIGIFGYMLDHGGSGDVLRTVYARDGTIVHVHHKEAPLVNMGLGPIEWFMLASAVLGIGKLALKYAVSRAAAARAAAAEASTKILLGPNEAKFGVIDIEREEIIAESADTGQPHSGFLWKTMKMNPPVPRNIEVVTFGKSDGEFAAMMSKGVHGREGPASAAAWRGILKKYR